MVNMLIPRVLEGQSGARAAHGIIAHGEVVATRVAGGVASGREATLEARWAQVLAPTDPLAPIGSEDFLGYTLSSVTVIDGGDYDVAPALHVVGAGQTHAVSTLSATVSSGIITTITVRDGGLYSRRTGGVIAQPPRRTHYADVAVLGNGGRRYTLRDCAAVIPVRVGDPVVVDAPNGDPRQGCFVNGRQVPARPLIFQSPPDLTPERDTDTRWRIGSRVPYRYLGWPQAYACDVSATVLLGWPGDANWRADRPTLAALDLQVVLQTMVAGDWKDLQELARIAARADLVTDPGGGTSRWQWTGIYQLDDGRGTLQAALKDGAPAAIALYVDAGAHLVRWNSSTSGWTMTAPDAVAIDPDDYVIQVVELGSGTY